MTERVLVRIDRLVVNDQHDRQFLQLQEAELADGRSERRNMTIVIGPGEAAEISRGLLGTQTARPLTHELTNQVLGELGASLEEIYIHDLRDGVYYAELGVAHQGGYHRIDCRPSDAVALSLRAGAPIYLNESLFQEATEFE